MDTELKNNKPKIKLKMNVAEVNTKNHMCIFNIV